MHAGPVRKAEEGELDVWGQFNVPLPVQMVAQHKDVVDTRWALTWEGAESKNSEKARLVAKGYQDPGLLDGSAETATCVGRRPSRSRLVSLGDLKKWELWSSDAPDSSPQADGFGREVLPRVPCE